MELTLTISGPLLKPEYQNLGSLSDALNDFVKNLADGVAKHTADKIRDKIREEIERSVQLAAYVGQSTDPEIIRTIINSVKVVVDGTDVIIKYEDDLKSLHGESPPELIEMLRGLIDVAIEKVSADDIGKKVLEAT